jgi:hypothetical protein
MEQATKDKTKYIYKSRLGPNVSKITIGYLVIAALGVTSFYFAKKDVFDNRQRQMLFKQEINESKSKYQSRLEEMSQARLQPND